MDTNWFIHNLAEYRSVILFVVIVAGVLYVVVPGLWWCFNAPDTDEGTTPTVSENDLSPHDAWD